MEKAYLDYAMSVIVSRALPDAHDGLKPVQRRIIYAMHTTGLSAGSKYQKCAAVIGETMKKYHPHGDMAIYDALVRMAQNFSLRYPLIDGQGNFGSIDGDSAAAMRYTECRLEKISSELLADIDKSTVEFLPNYSGEVKEPQVLPSKLPNLLLNGASGIAVGMATQIPPHNLGEIIDALDFMMENVEKEVLKDKPNLKEIKNLGMEIPDEVISEYPKKIKSFESTAEVSDLIKFVKGPDFPTGGIIYNQKEIMQVYATGKGRVVTRAKTDIEEMKGGRYAITVTEIPYMVNKSLLISKTANLVKDKKVDGISDIRDESDRSGMRIVFELKRDARPQRILNLLYKHTELQSTFNANIVALVNGEPRVLTLKMLLEEFIRHRQSVVIRRSLHLLRAAKNREHILLGLKIALDHLDAVIKTIRRSKNAEVAKENLMKKFKLTEIQAQAILDMQLRRLAQLERKKIEDELKDIITTIKKLEGILSSPKKILNIISKELASIREKYQDPRKTKVIKGALGTFAEEELIKKEDCILTLTHGGYIKRLNLDTYKRQGRGGKGVKGATLKEEDVIDQLRICNTHDDLYIFTNKGRVYKLKVWDIPVAGRTAKGTAVVNIINLQAGEKVSAVLPISKEEKVGYIFLATRLGTVKKTKLSEFDNIRSTGIMAIRLGSNDELIWSKVTSGKDHILLITAEGKSIRFKEKDVRPMGRPAYGVRGIKLSKTDQVVGMDLIEAGKEKGRLVLIASEGGYGKKTKLAQYRIQGRGGSGILTSKVNKKTGNLITSRIIDNTAKDLLLSSTRGQVIRLPLKSVSTLGRATQGVILMRLKAGDKLSALTIFEEEEELKKEVKKKK